MTRRPFHKVRGEIRKIYSHKTPRMGGSSLTPYCMKWAWLFWWWICIMIWNGGICVIYVLWELPWVHGWVWIEMIDCWLLHDVWSWMFCEWNMLKWDHEWYEWYTPCLCLILLVLSLAKMNLRVAWGKKCKKSSKDLA